MARQNLRDKLIRSGLQQLEREGFDVRSPSPGMVAGLQEKFGRDQSTDITLVHLLGRIADAASVAALEQLGAKANGKEVKREIRRSLFKLSQRGYAAAATLDEDAPQSRFTLAPEIEGYLSPVDGGGNYLLVLARPQVGGGLLVIQAAVNDREGLKRIGGNVIRRKEFRQMMSDLKAQHGISMVSIPWAYGDWRLHQAYEQARVAAAEGIEDYPTLRSHLTTAEVKEQPHPVFNHFDRQEIIESAQLDATGRLLEEPEFNMWLIDEALLAPFIEGAQALRDSRIVLNAMQKEERLQTIIKRAVEGIFLDDALGRIYGQRLEDVALHLARSEREEKARLLLGVALALERKETGGLLGIPLLEGLIRRSLSLYMEREKEKPEEPSLIIKP